MKILLLFSIAILMIGCNHRNQAKTFRGFWGDTAWTFEFKPDSTYARTSSGHYGNTVVEGDYRISGDTIILTSGFQNTHETVSEKYLIDGDSCIIDLKLKYDYCQPGNEEFHTSREREKSQKEIK